jgi:peptidoglycan hydrolase-like protein with peptidoglycan-binding domain
LLAGVRAAWRVLKDHYKVAPMIYTSFQVWVDNMPKDDPVLDLLESPLWVTPYYVGKKHNPLLDPKKVAAHKLASHKWYPPAWKKGDHHDPPLPPPWGDLSNWWIHQYQGDAINFPGFSGDVDMNRFHTMMPGETGDRVKWVQRKLSISETGSFDATMEKALTSFQTEYGLPADAVIGPATFARLCWA